LVDPLSSDSGEARRERRRQKRPAAVKRLFSHRAAFLERLVLIAYEILSFQYPGLRLA
jgi:hypothetical protein